MYRAAVAVAFFSAVLSLGSCQINLNAYPFSAVLSTDSNGDALFTLYWNFSVAEETIRFAVNVATDGWVGLGISPNGGMTNSDVAVGWVNDDGEAFFHDRFAESRTRPPIDPQQDWFLLNGENANGFTTMEFWRKWVTCDPDDRDRNILADTSRVVYAWNPDDPANDDPEAILYHGTNRGAASLNLLSGVTNPPQDDGNLQSFTIQVENVELPNADTTYWCAGLELPQEVQQQKQYIVRYAPRITPNDFQYVHHMLIYLCNFLNDTEVGNSGPCDGDVGITINECRQGSLIAGWAVGGTEFIYPENVAYPVGGPGNPRYVVIEMHYDNPNQNSGIMDSSGVEFFYTSEPREHEAGILNLGYAVSRFMVIPPNTPRYDIIGYCDPQCTSTHFPDDGIRIFGNLLHTHLVGSGVTLRLLRNTDTCSGLEELQPIDQNLQYDFNFQQFTILPNEVTVYPGDILLVECNYDTSERDVVTLGGESTRQEMCLSFPVYYPRVPLSTCFSLPGQRAFERFFFSGAVPFENLETFFNDWINGTEQEAENAFNQYVNWSPQTVQLLQESILGGDIGALCLTDDSDFVFRVVERYPNITCEYREPELCPAGAEAIVGNLVVLFGLVALALLLL